MSRDDIIYLILLVLSIPYGHLVKISGSAAVKKLMCFSAGLFVVLVLVGTDGIAHSLITILGNFILIQLVGPRYCRLVSFAFVFGYLFFFRTCERFGFAKPPQHSNAVQLLVTLRMVNLAFEHHDAYENQKTGNTDSSKLKIKKEFSASFFDFFAYGYCYIGLMTGPFYTYQTFQDMLHQDGTAISTIWPALRNLKQLPLIAVPYLYLAKNYPLNFLESDECLNHSWGVLYQLWILFPTFTWFRWRFYIGWMLAEAMCITAGLGAYPFECKSKPGLGPTQPIPDDFNLDESAKKHDGDTHDFETTHNIVILGVEFAPTMKSAMKVWNMTVQWWMATYVYKKLPVKSSQLRMFLLLFVSAFWHGVHPGYYATFLSVPFVVIAESRMIKAISPYLTTTQRYWFDWVTWFCLYRSFEYLGVGFMLLKLGSIWKVWTKMYFIGHIFIALFIILPIFISKKKAAVSANGDVDSEKLKAN